MVPILYIVTIISGRLILLKGPNIFFFCITWILDAFEGLSNGVS